jgi:hypothetical protein
MISYHRRWFGDEEHVNGEGDQKQTNDSGDEGLSGLKFNQCKARCKTSNCLIDQKWPIEPMTLSKAAVKQQKLKNEAGSA